MAFYVESTTYGYDTVWPHRHRRPDCTAGGGHATAAESVHPRGRRSPVRCLRWRQAARRRACRPRRRRLPRLLPGAPVVRQAEPVLPFPPGVPPAARRAAAIRPRAESVQARGGTALRRSRRSGCVFDRAPASTIVPCARPCAQRQGGGLLLGLLRLLANRPRHAPGGAHDDGGAGARSESPPGAAAGRQAEPVLAVPAGRPARCAGGGGLAIAGRPMPATWIYSAIEGRRAAGDEQTSQIRTAGPSASTSTGRAFLVNWSEPDSRE